MPPWKAILKQRVEQGRQSMWVSAGRGTLQGEQKVKARLGGERGVLEGQ